jgi:hypothetical protein
MGNLLFGIGLVAISFAPMIWGERGLWLTIGAYVMALLFSFFGGGSSYD